MKYWENGLSGCFYRVVAMMNLIGAGFFSVSVWSGMGPKIYILTEHAKYVY